MLMYRYVAQCNKQVEREKEISTGEQQFKGYCFIVDFSSSVGRGNVSHSDIFSEM